MKVNRVPKMKGPPTIVVRVQETGLKVELVDWQHNAPVRLLEGLDVMVQRAIHQWRAKFVAADVTFNTLSNRERDRVEDAKGAQQ